MSKTDYEKAAQFFILNVGGDSNIEDYFHCVSRLRFVVIDKSKVNETELKKYFLVRGLNWTGNQIQIILGTGVVDKVFAETDLFLQNRPANSNLQELADFKLKVQQKKASFKSQGRFAVVQNAMRGLGDIFLPIVPAIVAAGFAMGFAALFKQVGWIESGTTGEKILTIITNTAFSFLAVLVCWSAMKKFNGTPVVGIIIGIMLVNPILPDKSGIASWNAYQDFLANGHTEEQWATAGLAIPGEVYAWKIWIIPITGYQGSVLPALILGILAAYLEKGLKKIVPDAVNIVLTPFLTIVFTFLVGLLILGPLLSLVEQGVLIAVQWLIGIPYGFGTAITAGVIQAIVITGCHQILQGLEMQLVTAGSIPNADGVMTHSIFNAIWTASIISQGGAAFCLALKSQQLNDRRLGISSAASTFFGITEPAIFGVNLPKTKPFLFGLVGGFIGGWFAGILNVTCPGMGVTVLPGLLLYTHDWTKMLGIIGVNLISFVTAFLLVFFFCQEKVNIHQQLKRTIFNLAKKEKTEQTGAKKIWSQTNEFLKTEEKFLRPFIKTINQLKIKQLQLDILKTNLERNSEKKAHWWNQQKEKNLTTKMTKKTEQIQHLEKEYQQQESQWKEFAGKLTKMVENSKFKPLVVAKLEEIVKR